MKRTAAQLAALTILGAAFYATRAPSPTPHPPPFRAVSHDWIETTPRPGLPVGAPGPTECPLGCKNCALMLLTGGGVL